MLIDDLGKGSAKGRPAAEQLTQEDSQGIDVRGLHRVPGELFRGQVSGVGDADDVLLSLGRGRPVQQAAGGKIQQPHRELRRIILEDQVNVVGLQRAVDQPLPVGRVQGLTELSHEHQDLLCRYFFMLIQHLPQAQAVQRGHGHVEPPRLGPVPFNGDRDVRAGKIANLLNLFPVGLDLTVETDGLVEYLDSAWCPCVVFCGERLTRWSELDGLNEFVAANGGPGQRFHSLHLVVWSYRSLYLVRREMIPFQSTGLLVQYSATMAQYAHSSLEMSSHARCRGPWRTAAGRVKNPLTGCTFKMA